MGLGRRTVVRDGREEEELRVRGGQSWRRVVAGRGAASLGRELVADEQTRGSSWRRSWKVKVEERRGLATSWRWTVR